MQDRVKDKTVSAVSGKKMKMKRKKSKKDKQVSFMLVYMDRASTLSMYKFF